MLPKVQNFDRFGTVSRIFVIHDLSSFSEISPLPMLRLRYAYAMPLPSYNCSPQLRSAFRTELGGAVGLGAAVGAELVGAGGGRGEG